MCALRFQDRWEARDKRVNSATNVNVDLSTLSFTEEGIFFIYSPALDLTGYGQNEEEAKISFEISLQEFIRYAMNKGTFFYELERLGWKFHGRKSNIRLEQPDYRELAKSNYYLDEILNSKHYSEHNQSVKLPVYA